MLVLCVKNCVGWLGGQRKPFNLFSLRQSFHWLWVFRSSCNRQGCAPGLITNYDKRRETIRVTGEREGRDRTFYVMVQFAWSPYEKDKTASRKLYTHSHINNSSGHTCKSAVYDQSHILPSIQMSSCLATV